jgi:UDP-glucose 4-epimerase
MNFLVTGAAGFLGSALANELAREGHVVRGLDDLSSGDDKRLFEDVHFTRGDVNDRPKLWSLLQDIDCVYHLAARVRVAESLLYPREYTDVNVGGTVSLMEAMRDVGVRRVIFASSGAVYGEQATQPLRENMVANPNSPYAVSKLAAEHYVRTIGTLWEIETVSLRIFNAYGPGQNLPPSHPPVVPNWLRQAVRGGSLVLHGDGKQTRDFVYVTDVVRALTAAATAPSVDRTVINVGSGVETQMRDLAEMIIEVTGGEAEILPNDRNDPGVARTRADISTAKKRLNFTPRVTLEEGLKRTLEEDPRFDLVKA